MLVQCKSRREGNHCAIKAYGDHTISDGMCLNLCDKYDGPDREAARLELSKSIERADTKLKPGKLLRITIHFMLDCIDAFIRRRNRAKLFIIEKIKSCCGCKEREIKIDIYASQIMAKLHSYFGIHVGRVS